MSRPLRIEYPGAWYHVMNRGAARQEIFYDASDCHLFFELLAEIHQKYGIEVHAYCLMSNHYHLFLRTPLPNLSKAMRHLNGVFTQKHNRRNNQDGAIFRGRYKSILIDSENYMLILNRYIHLNPVMAGMVERPENYKWSSYNAYILNENKPNWLYCDKTLSYFDSHKKIQDYKNFVLSDMDSEITDFLNGKKISPILGSDEFIEKIKNNQLLRPVEEIPKYSYSGNKVLYTVQNIIDYLAACFNIDSQTIIQADHTKENLPRKIAIYLASKLTDASQQMIANAFNLRTYTAVSKNYRRLARTLKTNHDLAKMIEKIKQGVKSGQ